MGSYPRLLVHEVVPFYSRECEKKEKESALVYTSALKSKTSLFNCSSSDALTSAEQQRLESDHVRCIFVSPYFRVLFSLVMRGPCNSDSIIPSHFSFQQKGTLFFRTTSHWDRTVQNWRRIRIHIRASSLVWVGIGACGKNAIRNFRKSCQPLVHHRTHTHTPTLFSTVTTSPRKWASLKAEAIQVPEKEFGRAWHKKDIFKKKKKKKAHSKKPAGYDGEGRAGQDHTNTGTCRSSFSMPVLDAMLGTTTMTIGWICIGEKV
jgi:hypothetical protein